MYLLLYINTVQCVYLHYSNYSRKQDTWNQLIKRRYSRKTGDNSCYFHKTFFLTNDTAFITVL